MPAVVIQLKRVCTKVKPGGQADHHYRDCRTGSQSAQKTSRTKVLVHISGLCSIMAFSVDRFWAGLLLCAAFLARFLSLGFLACPGTGRAGFSVFAATSRAAVFVRNWLEWQPSAFDPIGCLDADTAG